MDEDSKLPLKRVELSLTKFNEVAIPHHLDLLRQHKANIIKYEQSGQQARVRSEQAHARRVCAQLRALLGELDALRRQVRACDAPRFDKLTERSRELTLRSIMDYLESSPATMESRGEAEGSTAAGASAGPPEEAEAERRQLLERQEEALRGREATLRGWAELQSEVRALHDAWQHVQAAALASREPVCAAATRVDAAADDVRVARTSLAAAERLRAGLCGVCGAAAGALVGGPMGLVLGAKAGLAAGLAAAGLVYAGARGLAPPARPAERP